jgi:hypothetical protein
MKPTSRPCVLQPPRNPERCVLVFVVTRRCKILLQNLCRGGETIKIDGDDFSFERFGIEGIRSALQGSDEKPRFDVGARRIRDWVETEHPTNNRNEKRKRIPQDVFGILKSFAVRENEFQIDCQCASGFDERSAAGRV